MTGPDDLVTVRILRLPLQVHARAQQQAAEMRREFQLVLGQDEVDPGSVPARLVELSALVSARSAPFTDEQERQIEQGVAAGQEQLEELVFQVPASVVEAVAELRAVLEEADQWCRRDRMLVLATPPDLVAYRRWYLDEFTRQAAGERPRPWDGPPG